MQDQIEFIVKMRDLMSGGLNRLSSTSQSSFNRMSAGAQAATNKNQILGMSFNELQKRIQETESTIKSSTIPSQIREARQELAALQRQANNHPANMSAGGGVSAGGGASLGMMGIAGGNIIGNLATQAGSMIFDAVKSGVGTMISKSMEKEPAITGLTTFLGKDGATEAYNNIRKDAAATPFDTASLLQVNRALISAGLSAKDARQDALNLGNAVSAVGGGNDVLSRMAANMQQIKTVGKATAMDIRQFGIAGINIYEMLARSTGKNIEQVKEMDVSYATLQKALSDAAGKGGIYEGAMAAQSQTKAGRWATIQDNFGNVASDIGDALTPVTDKLLNMAVQFAEWLPKGIEMAKPYIDMLSAGVGQIVDFIGTITSGTSEWSDWMNIIRGYGMILYNHLAMMGTKMFSLVSSIIDFVKHSEILKDVFRLIGWWFEKISAYIGLLMDGVIWLWENVVKPIVSAIDRAYKWIKGVDDVEVKATKTIVAPKKTDTPSALAENKKLVDNNATASKEIGSSVVGGGPKSITINVGKFFDNIQFTTVNGTESAQELEKIVMECLGRVIYQGSKVI